MDHHFCKRSTLLTISCVVLFSFIQIHVLAESAFVVSVDLTSEEEHLVPGWNEMSIEEKIKCSKEIMFAYIRESEFGDGDHKYTFEDVESIRQSIVDEVKNKYDLAFKRKERRNVNYLLFDFDDHELILLYESKYGRHYAEFTGELDTDWVIIENDDPFIDPWILRLIDNKLYYTKDNPKPLYSDFARCSMDEALKYLFSN